MTKQELNEILENRNITLDISDEMARITLEDKIQWEKESIIEEFCNCPNCNEKNLVGFDPSDNNFLCSTCGNIYNEKDLIK